MSFRTYPPIGFARLGHDVPQFFIGPELPGLRGFEPNSQGAETPVLRYKIDDPHNDQVKRQAARFRVFEVEAGAASREVQLPPGATVEWTVHLVNKKSAIQRPGSPPSSAQRPILVGNPAPLLIDPGARTISGARASGVKFDTGNSLGAACHLVSCVPTASKTSWCSADSGFPHRQTIQTLRTSIPTRAGM